MPELINNTLYVMTPGSSLHLDVDAVRVYHPETGAIRLPLVRIDHVVAFGGVTVSDDFMHRCAADQRSVTWVSGNGRFHARVIGPQGGNPLLRLAQHDAHRDEQRRVAISRAFVAASSTTLVRSSSAPPPTPPAPHRSCFAKRPPPSRNLFRIWPKPTTATSSSASKGKQPNAT